MSVDKKGDFGGTVTVLSLDCGGGGDLNVRLQGKPLLSSVTLRERYWCENSDIKLFGTSGVEHSSCA